ncbi:hypothetical protein HMPREF0972_00595 [Actinomyces sp. oral taxon 848 str. F0332]|nr:hypothetical protein HMPREF0972_00595 [Actinomyces sp. oral taxon 848 str. F0332]
MHGLRRRSGLGSLIGSPVAAGAGEEPAAPYAAASLARESAAAPRISGCPGTNARRRAEVAAMPSAKGSPSGRPTPAPGPASRTRSAIRSMKASFQVGVSIPVPRTFPSLSQARKAPRSATRRCSPSDTAMAKAGIWRDGRTPKPRASTSCWKVDPERMASHSHSAWLGVAP